MRNYTEILEQEAEPQSNFGRELMQLINRYSEENNSDTPDYILAYYLQNCLDNWNKTLFLREKHKYGK